MDVDLAAGALGTALHHDRTLTGEPARLARALHDLLPHDEGAVALLVAGAGAGVPGLLTGLQDREARNHLIDQLGLRAEVAEQVVSAWRAALVGQDQSAGPVTPDPVATESEEPGPPTATALGPGSELAVVTGGGVFVSVAAGQPVWRRVASPDAPTSRDVAIAGGHVVWTGAGGVFARRLGSAGAVVSLGEQRVVAVAAQPRYPLAALGLDGESVDVFWTPDRVVVRHSALRGWETGSALEIPASPDGERLTALAASAQGGRTVWLAALTEAGTVAIAGWDVPTGTVGSWTVLRPPARLGVVTVAGGLLLGYTTGGHLLAYDVSGAKWRSVDPPAGVPRPQRAPHALSATTGRVLVSDATGTWLATLAHRDGVPELSDARMLPL